MRGTELGRISQIGAGLSDSRLRSDEGRAVPIVHIKDLRDDLLPSSRDLDMRTVATDADIGRYQIAEGDVLLTCRGTQLRAVVTTAATAGAIISSNLIVIRLREELLPEVLLAFLRSSAGRRALRSFSHASTMLALKPADVAQLRVPVPPLRVQRHLAELMRESERHHRAALVAAEGRRAVAQRVVEDVLQGRTTTTT